MIILDVVTQDITNVIPRSLCFWWVRWIMSRVNVCWILLDWKIFPWTKVYKRNKKITDFCPTNKTTEWWWPYVKFALNNKPSVSVKRLRRDVTECAVIHVRPLTRFNGKLSFRLDGSGFFTWRNVSSVLKTFWEIAELACKSVCETN